MLRELKTLGPERHSCAPRFPTVSLESEFKAGLQSMGKELGGVTGLRYVPAKSSRGPAFLCGILRIDILTLGIQPELFHSAKEL